MCKRYFFILFVLKICTFRFANYILFLFVSIYFSLYKKVGKHNDGEEIHKRSIRKKVEWK